MIDVTAHLQYSSKKYDTFACAIPLNGNHVFITLKLRRDTLPDKPLELNVTLKRERETNAIR